MFKATSVVSQLYWNIIEALFCLVYFFKVSPVKMALSAELSLANVVLLYTFVFASKYLWKLFQKWQLEKILKKWESSPNREKVILHTLWRCKTIPSMSPFAMKLETYLRMAKIPYELDTTDLGGPKGKLPWITYNGINVADSHLCIQFLNKKFSIDLNKSSGNEETQTARACRIMLEEHFNWGIIQLRWVENISKLTEIIKMPCAFNFGSFLIKHQTKSRMEGNGIGMHKPTEIYQMTEEDLRTVSIILGNKKFLGGDVPCEEDCSVFGFIAQCIWAAPGSCFEKLISCELSNLKDYCERIKNLYWTDWENCLDKS